MTADLVVSNLTKIFGSGEDAVHAVNDVTLHVAVGQFAAIVGPSGSGKTTLLAMIGGLLSPTSGVITLDGYEVTGSDRKALADYRRNRVGFVFQQYNLVPYLTARENVFAIHLLGGRVPATIRDRADQLLAELGMTKRANALPSDLSGGERQRVSICRALVNNPDLLLVDEPTASLDSARGHQVVELIAKESRDRQKIGVMVTHDLEMTDVADVVFEMHDGTLSTRARRSA